MKDKDPKKNTKLTKLTVKLLYMQMASLLMMASLDLIMIQKIKHLWMI